jgi:hypothetical protein
MSYRCQITNRISKLGEKLNKITVETRPRNYTKWVRDEESRIPKWTEVPCSSGWEIVRELNACSAGLELWESYSTEDKAMFLKHLDAR